jgi:hypothetical protein
MLDVIVAHWCLHQKECVMDNVTVQNGREHLQYGFDVEFRYIRSHGLH